MIVTPKLLLIAGLVAALPLTINMVLSTQVLKNQAAMLASSPSTFAPNPPPGCFYKPQPQCTIVCPINNPNCCLTLVCPTPTPEPTGMPRPDTDTKLSCATCLKNGLSDVCFNVKHGTSFCKRSQEIPESRDDETPENLDDRISLNVLCMRCPVPTISVTPLPTLPCLPMPPQCQPGSPLGIACPNPPPGGWCSSSPSPTPH